MFDYTQVIRIVIITSNKIRKKNKINNTRTIITQKTAKTKVLRDKELLANITQIKYFFPNNFHDIETLTREAIFFSIKCKMRCSTKIVNQ